MTRRNRKSYRSKKNKVIQRNLLRNIAIIIVLIVFLFVIYRFNFSSKSELTETVKISFNEFGENASLGQQEIDMEVLTDSDGVKYILLPDKINGYYVQQYYINKVDNNSGTSSPTNEINNTNTILENVVVDNNGNTNVTDEIAGLKKYYLTSKGTETNENNNQYEENDLGKEENNNTSKDSTISNTVNNSELNNNTNENYISNNTIIDDKIENGKEENVLDKNEINSNTIENSTVEKNEVVVDENNKQDEDIPSNDIQDSNNPNDIEELLGIKPGTRYNVYETEEKGKYTLGDVTVEVEFQTIINEDIKLYNQELFFKDDTSEITVTGYIPAEYKLNCTKENSKELEVELNEYEDLKDNQMLWIYDISVEKDGDIYQPKNYNFVPDLSVNIQSIDLNSLPDKQDVKLIHFADQIETIENFELNSNSIEFISNGFSKYAVLSKKAITETSVTIDTREEDKNYYLGKNYTDQITGENSKQYSEANLANVTINYHSKPQSDAHYENVPYGKTYKLNVERVEGSRDTNTGIGTVVFKLKLEEDNDINLDGNWKIELKFVLTNNCKIKESDRFKYTINGNEIILDSKDGYQFVNNGGSKELTIEVTVQCSNWRHISDNDANLIIEDSYSCIYSIPDNNTGYISATERQNVVTYKKTIPVIGGQISFDLIDNPFMDRPVGTVYDSRRPEDNPTYQTLFGFNGWIGGTDSSYNIETDTDENYGTYIQTLTTYLGEDINNVVIDLYADWIPANAVFVANTGTSEGVSSPEQPIDSWKNAIKELEANKKTASNASDREVNIIVVVGKISDDGKALSTEIPYTVTSLYNGTDYRISPQNASIEISDRGITLNNDLQLDFLNVINSNDYKDTRKSLKTLTKYINANSYNLRIGRGMTPLNGSEDTTTFTQIQCGGINNKKYKTVIESGRYSNIYVDRASIDRTDNNFFINGILIVGCDYDRYIENGNNNLNIFSKVISRSNISKNAAKDPNSPIYDIYIKSGNIGIDCFKEHPEAQYSGIYLGGNVSGGESSNDYDEGERRLTVEGGNIANIIGGLKSYESLKDSTKTYIYVKGKDANIQNIIGGCVKVKTSSDRIIQLTDGTIEYSIFSGSNGKESTTNDVGSLAGSTLLYIGGNAKIGGINRLSMYNGTDGGDSLYGLKYGSVLGAGNGNPNVNTAGVVNSSHIIIDGEAQIKNNVYGGGNFSGVQGNTKIDMYGGTIGGTIYGGSNNLGTITRRCNYKYSWRKY